MKAEEPDWTKGDLEKLLRAMKRNIPGRFRRSPYSKGQSGINWERVAFDPYSSEACQKKWQQVCQKISKIRTLPELLCDAEDVIANPFKGNNYKIYPGFPKKPTSSNNIFFLENLEKLKRENPGLRRQELLTLANDKYNKLPEHKKIKYINRFQLAHKEYQQRLLQLRKQYRPVGCVKQRHLKSSKGPMTPHELKYTHERAVLRTNPKISKIRTLPELICDAEDVNANPFKEKIFKEEDQRAGIQETSIMQKNPNLCTTGRLLKTMPVKPPINGFAVFVNDLQASEGNSDKIPRVVCSQLWRQLTEIQREKYRRHQLKMKDQYKIDMKQYLHRLPEEEQKIMVKECGFYSLELALHSLKAVRRLKNYWNEPRMPSRAGNVLFCQEKMELLKQQITNSRKRFAEANQMWKTLSATEKKTYNQAAQKNFREYVFNLQQWFDALTVVEQANYLKENPKKSKFLRIKRMEEYIQKEARAHRTSDSEDENIENSSNEEEEDSVED